MIFIPNLTGQLGALAVKGRCEKSLKYDNVEHPANTREQSQN